MKLNSLNDSKSMNVLVIGDKGVGKSSLISTFLSRQFSESVPRVMSKIRVPVEASHNESSYSTAIIIDTEGHKELGLQSINAIIMVYDLSDMDTFNRLESHWLPLLEQKLDNMPAVIVAGNKMDLETTDEQSQARSRHQIVSLLQQFKFVRQCIKCSAKNIWNVNDVFLKAQHAVLYPINPLYDLSLGKLSNACMLALTHIFRLFDADKDSLLSDHEINSFQRHCFKSLTIDRDLSSWKKLLSKASQNTIQDNKFTIHGFLAMFDTYINSDRIEIPWIVLRSFGYDNNLLLIDKALSFSSSSAFTSSELLFLLTTFYQFTHDKLSSQHLSDIFYHVHLPPWSSLRVNEKYYSQPIDLNYDHLSLDQWMNLWHMMLNISTFITRKELYYLGYDPNLHINTDKTSKNKIVPSNLNSKQLKHLSSKTIRIALIGSSGCGKSTLLHLVHQQKLNYSKATKPLTTCAYRDFNNDSSTTFINYIFTEISVDYATSQLSQLSTKLGFDLVLFLFDSSAPSSLDFVLNLESKHLNENIPRLYVAINDTNDTKVLDKASQHCEKLELEQPHEISINKFDNLQFLQYIGRFTLDPTIDKNYLHVKPFEERKRRENAARKTIIWIGGFVVAAAAVVVVSVVMFWKSNKSGRSNRISNGIKVGK